MIRFCLVSCRRLKQLHLVALSKAQRHVSAHGNRAWRTVTLVSNENAWEILARIVHVTLGHPLSQVFKGCDFCYIVDKDYTVHIAIVVRHHALAETLLASCVPDLQLKNKPTNVMYL